MFHDALSFFVNCVAMKRAGRVGMPAFCLALLLHAGTMVLMVTTEASTGSRQSEDPRPERRGRSLREARAVRCAQEGFRCCEGRLSVIEYPGAVHAFTNSEATELGKKFNLPLRYDAKVDQEAKAEAAKFFAAKLQK